MVAHRFSRAALARTDGPENWVVRREPHAFVILNIYPYNSGHLLVCPYRHVADYTELTDDEVVAWVKAAHETTQFTTSVCTGSLVLGAAGLLDGLTATTHWACYRELEAHGATAVADRVVEHLDRRIITAAGVSSGIDMALRLVELLVDRTAAEAAQLMIEYDPQPPFDCGSLAKVQADGDDQIAPGLVAVPTYGHTPGHQSAIVRLAGGEELYQGRSVFCDDVLRPRVGQQSPHAGINR